MAVYYICSSYKTIYPSGGTSMFHFGVIYNTYTRNTHMHKQDTHMHAEPYGRMRTNNGSTADNTTKKIFPKK